MKPSRILITSALAGLLASGAAAAADQGQPASNEVCYGVAKAGQNDCGNAHHDCAGEAKRSNDPEEWKYVPSGTCAKLGGTAKPGTADGKKAPESK